MAQAHTARFLQTFHSAQTTAQRTAASETATPTDHADTDPAALAFVKGQRPVKFAAPVPNAGGEVVEIKGHKVRCGGPFISEAQAKWIIDIVTTRVIPEGRTAESVLVRLEQGFAKFAGSQFITQYKDLPRAMAEFQDALRVVKTRTKVADGRYAVEHEGTLKFFKVKNGRKAGFVFLDVQASDDWHSIRTPRRIHEILELIAADELTAARRYGQELGQCSRCGRTLTDETSRAYGIGPDCRSK
jgi:hypothetical protein